MYKIRCEEMITQCPRPSICSVAWEFGLVFSYLSSSSVFSLIRATLFFHILGLVGRKSHFLSICLQTTGFTFRQQILRLLLPVARGLSHLLSYLRSVIRKTASFHNYSYTLAVKDKSVIYLVGKKFGR